MYVSTKVAAVKKKMNKLIRGTSADTMRQIQGWVIAARKKGHFVQLIVADRQQVTKKCRACGASLHVVREYGIPHCGYGTPNCGYGTPNCGA